MAQGQMLNLNKLAMGANDAYNILTMPSLAEIQKRLGHTHYNMGGYHPLPNMEGYRPSEDVAVNPTLTPGNPGQTQAMNLDYRDLEARDALNGDSLGGAGGDMRSPMNLGDSTITGTTYDPNADNPAEDTQNPPANDAEGSDSTDPQQSAIEQRITATNDIRGLLAILQELANMSPEEGGDPVFNLDAQFKRTSPMTNIGGTSAGLPQPRGDIMQTINLGNM